MLHLDKVTALFLRPRPQELINDVDTLYCNVGYTWTRRAEQVRKVPALFPLRFRCDLARFLDPPDPCPAGHPESKLPTKRF